MYDDDAVIKYVCMYDDAVCMFDDACMYDDDDTVCHIVYMMMMLSVCHIV